MSSPGNKQCSTIHPQGTKPGVLHIFNHSQFNGNLKLEERKGTELDVKELKQTFEIYGVTTFTHNNLTLKKIRRKIEKISTTDFSENSCIVVVFLTHGFQNNIIAAKNTLFSFNEMILKIQSNETLKFKPKIFLIQACRADISNRLYNKYVKPNFNIEPEYLNETCVLNSSTELMPSSREGTKGTPFIQLFCQILQIKGSDLCIADIFDLVMITVKNQMKQSPEIKRNTVAPYIFGDYCKELVETGNQLSQYSEGASTSIDETEKPNEKYIKLSEVTGTDSIQHLSELELSDDDDADDDDDYIPPIKQIIQDVADVIEFAQENDRLTINEKAEQFIAKFKSEDVEKWVQVCPCGRSPIPENPVIGGYDIDGHPIYIGRAIWYYELLPAKVSLERKHAFVAYDCREHKTTDFDVLTGTDYSWVPAARGSVPSNAVRGGMTWNGEILYIGRAVHDTSITPGKIHPSHECLYIPFDGLEIRFLNYEVLVKTTKNEL